MTDAWLRRLKKVGFVILLLLAMSLVAPIGKELGRNFANWMWRITGGGIGSLYSWLVVLLVLGPIALVAQYFRLRKANRQRLSSQMPKPNYNSFRVEEEESNDDALQAEEEEPMTDANEIKAGDVVVLKSGGPRMTVIEVDENLSDVKVVRCSWFDGNKNLSDTFPLISVEKE